MVNRGWEFVTNPQSAIHNPPTLRLLIPRRSRRRGFTLFELLLVLLILALTAALVAPVGFLMGVPFPKGALRVGPLVDWGFAVNGAASVLGGTAVLLVAFDVGFAVALSLAAVLYLVAWGLMSRRQAW